MTFAVDWAINNNYLSIYDPGRPVYAGHLHPHRDYYSSPLLVLQGDDDAYVVLENLRYVLARYDPGRPVYVGHLYRQRHPHRDYYILYRVGRK